MEKRVPLGPFSPLSQSPTTKVFSTLPLVAFSSKLSVVGGLVNIGGQSLKSSTWMFTVTSTMEGRETLKVLLHYISGAAPNSSFHHVQ